MDVKGVVMVKASTSEIIDEMGDTESSRTSICCNDEQHERPFIDRGSSSNSTVEEDEKKPSVRPYARSKVPRVRWTSDLHNRFVHAVERLGGQDRATPRLVLQLMNVKGLNISHVKSHLQMYRSKKIDSPSQGNPRESAHKNIFRGVGQTVYNLSQFPLLPGFNQYKDSTLRYRDASLAANTRQNAINKKRPGFDEALLSDTRFTGYNYFDTINPNSCSRLLSSLQSDEFNHGNKSLVDQESCHRDQLKYKLVEPKPSKPMEARNIVQDLANLDKIRPSVLDKTTAQRNIAIIKREEPDYIVDLNLSLRSKAISRGSCGMEGSDEEDRSLSLSLRSSSSTKIRKLNQDDCIGNARRASTLDLTL